ncbi:helix-turn-helix domain-containing protein [Brevundimonas staleyi]|uniref:Helix-turn-helix domain-containing protein n=1 Tax=Brevundimonas staleyi TaxID=74326 RepID=A0ABW0FX46_9CAUL
MNRQQMTAQTRAEIVAAARRVFSHEPYPAVSVRRIAAEAGRTTGAVYGHFRDKAALWREAMGTPPPLDTPLTRHAGGIERALRGLVALQRDKTPSSPAWDEAWDQARLALRTLDRTAKGPIADRPPRRAGSPAAQAPIPPVDLEQRLALISALFEEADRMAWRPVAFEQTTRALTEACARIVSRESGTATDEQVRQDAVRAAARLLVAAAGGVAGTAPGAPDVMAPPTDRSRSRRSSRA